MGPGAILVSNTKDFAEAYKTINPAPPVGSVTFPQVGTNNPLMNILMMKPNNPGEEAQSVSALRLRYAI